MSPTLRSTRVRPRLVARRLQHHTSLIALVLIAIGCEVAIDPSGTSRPRLTAQDAKTALVGMLRREADRDPSRCREIWGSTEMDQQLAAKPIEMNCQLALSRSGSSPSGWMSRTISSGRVRTFSKVRSSWKQDRWRASDYRLTAHGDNFGRGGRKK